MPWRAHAVSVKLVTWSAATTSPTHAAATGLGNRVWRTRSRMDIVDIMCCQHAMQASGAMTRQPRRMVEFVQEPVSPRAAPLRDLSLIHISEPTRQAEISYAV